MRPSMGSVGDAYDNAMCESFFATLECELLDRRRFKTQAEARIAAFVEPELPRQFHEPALGAPREVLARWRQLCWQLMGTTMVSQTDDGCASCPGVCLDPVCPEIPFRNDDAW